MWLFQNARKLSGALCHALWVTTTDPEDPAKNQAPVVQKVNYISLSTEYILYSVDNAIGLSNTDLLDIDYPMDSAVQHLYH